MFTHSNAKMFSYDHCTDVDLENRWVEGINK